MKIIITGSMGHISKPLTEKLVKQGHAVTVITTDPQKQTGIEKTGATAKIGSVDDIPFLTTLFKEADAAYCMTPPSFAEPDQIAYYERIAHNYAKAVQHSGIKKIIYLSSYGAHLSSGTGYITGSYRAENILNAIPNVAVTHVRPTFFYYNFFGFIPMIKKAGFIGAVYGGDDKLSMVSPVDIADAIAEEITKPANGHTIKYVASDDRTCNEVARVLGEAIGRPDLQWNVLSAEQAIKGLQENGMPKNAAETLVELGGAIHSGVLREDYEKHKPVFGKISLEDFAIEFASIYQQEI